MTITRPPFISVTCSARMCRAIAAVSILATSACGLEAGTGGERIEFRFAVDTRPDIAEPFVTASGWTVEIYTAHMTLGPAWIYENPPSASQTPGPSWLARVHELLVPSVWAHPGDAFFNGGQLRGEFLEQHVYDLVDGQLTELGAARGVAGPCGSLTLVLDPPSSATNGDTSILDSYPVWVAGRASRSDERGDMEVVDFAGGLDLEPDDREVTSIAADFDLEDKGLVVLQIDARTWFDEAQFDRLELADEAGIMQIETGTQVAIAWQLGLRNARNYSARWEPAQK